MSRWSDLIGALETQVRAASTVPTALPAGAEGWSRFITSADKLNQGQFPHVFVDVIIEDGQTLAHVQRRVTTRILLHLWTLGETLAQIETRVDSIEAALLTSYTLGGLCRDISITSKGIADATTTGDQKLCAVLILEAWKVL
jgi:hypothetical protein